MKSALSKLFMVSIVAGLLITGTACALYTWLNQKLPIEKTCRFLIPQGANRTVLTKQFQKAGISVSPHPIKWAFRFFPDLTTMKPGIYLLKPGMRLLPTLRLFTTQPTGKLFVCIPEGLKFAEFKKRLKEAPFLTDVEHFDSIVEKILKNSPLKLTNLQPEGLFFPATYYYEVDSSVETILTQAHQKLLAVLYACWSKRAPHLPLRSPYELLIMASILEKECAVEKEGAYVAGILYNRLRKKMKLELCTTAIYGIGEAYQGQGRLRFADFKLYNPYNTYCIYGLPPTPISLPSKKALEVAARPRPSEHLYFVTAGNGTHIFSKNLREHEYAVRKYLAHCVVRDGTSIPDKHP